MSRKPIFNVADAEFQVFAARGRYEPQMARLGATMGAEKISFNVTRLAPGKMSFPYHFHHANDELFLVLAGTGTLRYDGAEYPVRSGDLICCPPGPDSAHQFINDSEEELRYLAISSAHSPEVVEYPDSGKFGVSHWPDIAAPPAFRRLGFLETEVDYFEREELAAEDGD